MLKLYSVSIAKYQAMQEKIALIREARESLDGMRNQHREKLRHQELEQEMLRRMQMEQKLELMRQQKQEYLEYQRQLQIQRQQELEAQQQMKFQQKQLQFQGPYGNRQLPMQVQMVPGQETFIATSQYQQIPSVSQGQSAQVGQYTGQYPQAPVSYGSSAEGVPAGQNQPSPSIAGGPNPVSSNQSAVPQQQPFDGQQYRQPLYQEPPGQLVRNPLPQNQPMQQQFVQQPMQIQQLPMQRSPQQPPQQQTPPQQQGLPQQQAPPQQQTSPQQQGISHQAQQSAQVPSQVPDLLDAPIGAEMGMHSQESRYFSYFIPFFFYEVHGHHIYGQNY